MKTVITLLTALLVGSGGISTLPDLCTQSVFINPSTGKTLGDQQGTSVSRTCVWTGPDAPTWDAAACCAIEEGGAWCVPPNGRGDCDTEFSPYYCEYGEQTSTGGVVCYQRFPSACELGNCAQPAELPVQSPDMIQEDVICCIGGTCYEWDDAPLLDCEGLLMWCNWGYSTVDGTVECLY